MNWIFVYFYTFVYSLGSPCVVDQATMQDGCDISPSSKLASERTKRQFRQALQSASVQELQSEICSVWEKEAIVAQVSMKSCWTTSLLNLLLFFFCFFFFFLLLLLDG
jgi:hypothetical protein